MEADVLWTRKLADELWSGVVTPLTFAFLAEEMTEHMARRRLLHAGLEASSQRPVFRLVRGHVYVNASLVAEVMRELPAPVVSDGLLALLPESLRAEVRAGCRASLSPSVLRTVLRLTWSERAWMPWARAALFRAEAENLPPDLGQSPDLAPLPGPVLTVRMRDLKRGLGRYLEVVSWGMIYAYVFFHLTAELLRRWDDGADISLLLAGTAGIRTFEVHDELGSCVALLRCDIAARAAVLGEDPAVIAERCLAGEMGGLGVRLRALLERHGHRLVGRDLACPTWRERPAVIVEMIRQLLAAEPGADRRSRRAQAAVEASRTLARIEAGLGGSLRREVFRLSLRWCQEYYAMRENMRYHADRFLAALRAVSLAAGRRLVEGGALASSEDVFYLTAEELFAALDGGAGSGPGLSARASARRRDYDLYRAAPPPEILRGDREETEPGRAAAAPRSLQGIGVSPGRAAGRARVVRRVEDLEAVCQGEVIVAASTDPSWTSVLSLGGALVLEVGGMLSHGAIVARELGIPAVAEVAGATTILRTGDRLTVDGRSGQVALT